MGIYICQNSSKSTLKICVFTICKLYLSEEKVYFLAFLCVAFFYLLYKFNLLNSHKNMGEAICLFVLYRWENRVITRISMGMELVSGPRS